MIIDIIMLIIMIVLLIYVFSSLVSKRSLDTIMRSNNNYDAYKELLNKVDENRKVINTIVDEFVLLKKTTQNEPQENYNLRNQIIENANIIEKMGQIINNRFEVIESIIEGITGEKVMPTSGKTKPKKPK